MIVDLLRYDNFGIIIGYGTVGTSVEIEQHYFLLEL